MTAGGTRRTAAALWLALAVGAIALRPALAVGPAPAPAPAPASAVPTSPVATGQAPTELSATLAALFAQDEYEQVVATALPHLEATPDDTVVLRLMGFALLRKGELSLAAAALESALAASENSAVNVPLDVPATLAEIDLWSGRADAASARAESVMKRYAGSDAARQPVDFAGAARAARVLARQDPAYFQAALDIYEAGIARYPESRDLRIGLGRLLLHKYNNAEARILFVEALKPDPEYPAALLALARSESFDESPEAVKLARHAVQLRPGWAEARQVLARILLHNHDFAGAAEQIDAALAIDPNSAETRGLEGALALLQADENRMIAAIEHAGRAMPGNLDGLLILADIAVRNRLYPYAVEFARQAVAADQRNWRAYSVLGMNQLRIGAMRPGRRNLRRAFAGDPFNVWVKNTLDLMDRMDDFEEYRSEHFVLVADPEEGRILANFVLPMAELAFTHYSERYGYQPPTPIRIEVFARHEDFSVRTVGLVGVDILGASFGSVIAMDSPSTRSFGPVNWASVVWHEISHSFHLGLSRFRVPRWFTEGLAVLEEHRARPGWGGDVSPGFLIAFRRGELPSASSLEQAFQRPATSEQVSHYYYLSYLLAEFIERHHGVEAIVRMLEGYAEGRSVNELVGAVTGLYGPGLDGALNRHIELRFASSIAALTPLVDLDAISTDEAANPYEVTFKSAAAAMHTGELAAAETAFLRAIELFPEYAGPDSAYHQLAKIYADTERPAQARRMLERIVAINADDLSAQQQLTDLVLAQGQSEEAIEALQKLELIDPLDPERQRQLANFYEARAEWMLATRARAAVLDLGPADRAGAHFELARALTRAGDPQAGRQHILRSLEIAPLFDDGLELLLEIRAATAAQTSQ